ncbi:MAG: hypothetical protein JRN34_03545 [Nitrososphaerota archaeon]|nr:hypothetical protein [Nitrososphaerota archaeon]
MESEFETIGFDSILFRRSWIERRLSETEPNTAEDVTKTFVSPLGCGVLVSDFKSFRGEFVKAFSFQASEFKIHLPFLFVPSSVLIGMVGLPKTIAFVDRLLHQIEKRISAVHASFVTLPVLLDPTVRVGGLLSPSKDESAKDYLVHLQNPMPYLTAYSFRGSKIGQDFTGRMVMDSFESSKTRAWDRLTDAELEVFVHGDECNPLVCTADLMCFYINFKLYQRATYDERKLDYKNVAEVLSEFPFLSTIYRFDQETKEAFVHYNYKPIEYMEKVKHPVTFLMYDKPQGQSLTLRDVVSKRLWYCAAKKAYSTEGCFKRFNWDSDAKYVDDGDTIVCVGSESMRVAQTLKMAANVKIQTGLQFRDEIEKTGI